MSQKIMRDLALQPFGEKLVLPATAPAQRIKTLDDCFAYLRSIRPDSQIVWVQGILKGYFQQISTATIEAFVRENNHRVSSSYADNFAKALQQAPKVEVLMAKRPNHPKREQWEERDSPQAHIRHMFWDWKKNIVPDMSYPKQKLPKALVLLRWNLQVFEDLFAFAAERGDFEDENALSNISVAFDEIRNSVLQFLENHLRAAYYGDNLEEILEATSADLRTHNAAGYDVFVPGVR